MTSAADKEVPAAVAAAGWTELLPAHRAGGADQPVGEPRCLDALPLGGDRLVAVVADGNERIYPVPLMRDGAGVRRARPGEGAAEAVVAMLARPQSEHDRFRVTTWNYRATAGERPITVDQTNESVVIGDAAVVKWAVLAAPGPHPAPSLLALLARAGFAGTPQPWGALEWLPPGEPEPRLLALVTGFVPGAVDGWTWAVEELLRAATSDDLEPARLAGGEVGRLVAAFHLALEGTAAGGAFNPAAWRTDALADLDQALAVSTGRALEVLAPHADQVRQVFSSISPEPRVGIRVHGDLHLGQVLRTERAGTPTYLLTDFEGNPVAAPGERVRAQPAALDVAGAAQSMVHAGLVVRRHNPDVDAGRVTAAVDGMRGGFLDAYRETLDSEGGFLDDSLLHPFAVRQVCREFIYAATHLPRWSYVPEAALPMLLAGRSA